MTQQDLAYKIYAFLEMCRLLVEYQFAVIIEDHQLTIVERATSKHFIVTVTEYFPGMGKTSGEERT